jgi:Skp family chaperone for outer membrane proteins
MDFRIPATLLALLLGSTAAADSRLDHRLGLAPQQARAVAEIEAHHRRAFAAVRQDYNREMRALRRARLAHDSAETARLEAVTVTLREELRRLYRAEDDAIRAQLDAAQLAAFEDYVRERAQMRGSSRDERIFEDG